MSTFAKEGFLSSAMVKPSQEFCKQYSEWFKLCESINKFSLALASKLRCHKDNRQEWLTAALLLRMISVFEAMIILIQHCMIGEAWILLRALMEALFALRSVGTNKQVAEEYYQSHLSFKIQALKKLSRYSRADKTDLNKLIEELKAQIKGEASATVTTEYLANMAGLGDYYNTIYPTLSWTTHSNIIDIAKTYLVGHPDGYPESVYLSYETSTEDVERLFMTTLKFMVIALQSVNDLFKTGNKSEIADYEKLSESLYASHRKANNSKV